VAELGPVVPVMFRAPLQVKEEVREPVLMDEGTA
jgi:hypothetical protein